MASFSDFESGGFPFSIRKSSITDLLIWIRFSMLIFNMKLKDWFYWSVMLVGLIVNVMKY